MEHIDMCLGQNLKEGSTEIINKLSAKETRPATRVEFWHKGPRRSQFGYERAFQ